MLGREALHRANHGLLRRSSPLRNGHEPEEAAVHKGGQGGMDEQNARERRRLPQRRGKPVHKRDLQEDAWTTPHSSKHERRGEVLRQLPHGELFCDSKEGEALPDGHDKYDGGGGKKGGLTLHLRLLQPGRVSTVNGGLPPTQYRLAKVVRLKAA